MAFKSFDILRQAGFDNLNLDLMFAIPGQTLEVWRETLNEATAMGSEHLSSYEVIYEEDTPLYEQLQAGKVDVDEDLACAMYEELVERATQRRLPAIRSRQLRPRPRPQPSTLNPQPSHPRLPAQRQLLARRLLLRPGSQRDQLRARRAHQDWSNTQLYCEQLEQGQRAIESREELAPLARAGETAAFGLRMVAGWPFEQFRPDDRAMTCAASGPTT